MSVRVEIELDIEKIQREGKYDVNQMYLDIDSLFVENGAVRCQPEDGEGIAYTGHGTDKDLAIISCAINEVEDCDWFIDNVLRWVWFIGDGACIIVEDLLAEHQSGI